MKDKEKNTEKLLLRMGATAKKYVSNESVKMDRSINWYILNLIHKDMQLRKEDK